MKGITNSKAVRKKKRSWFNLRWSSEICLEGLTKSTKRPIRTAELLKFLDANNYTVLWSGILKTVNSDLRTN